MGTHVEQVPFMPDAKRCGPKMCAALKINDSSQMTVACMQLVLESFPAWELRASAGKAQLLLSLLGPSYSNEPRLSIPNVQVTG